MFNSVIALAPEWPAGHFWAGFRSMQNQDYAGAVSHFSRDLELVPGDPLVLCWRGRMREMSQDLTGAAADYEAALQSSPDLLVAHHNLAWLQGAAPDDGVRSGRKSLQHAEFFARANSKRTEAVVLLLAVAHAEAGDLEKALQLAQEAAAISGQPRNSGSFKVNVSGYQLQDVFEKQQAYRQLNKYTPPESLFNGG